MLSIKSVDKILRNLFVEEAEMERAGVALSTRKRVMRLRAVYSYWLSDPKRGEREIASMLVRDHGVSVMMAYEDVTILKKAIGNLNETSRQWYMWLFTKRCEEGFEMARKKGDVNAFAKVLGQFIKGSGIARAEELSPDYSGITPPDFEITADAAAAGAKPVPGLERRIEAMRRRYVLEAKDKAEDAEEIKKIPSYSYGGKTNNED